MVVDPQSVDPGAVAYVWARTQAAKACRNRRADAVTLAFDEGRAYVVCGSRTVAVTLPAAMRPKSLVSRAPEIPAEPHVVATPTGLETIPLDGSHS